MDVENSIDQITSTWEELANFESIGSLMLVDLVDSTSFKMQHPEPVWLQRLLKFRRLVEHTLNGIKPTKYLGDAILYFINDSVAPPTDLVHLARVLIDKMNELNTSLRGEHTLHIRIIFDYGTAYCFDGSDPQGTVVDRVFRFEKHVPPDCIGLTQAFNSKLSEIDVIYAGNYKLKSFNQGSQSLYLLNDGEMKKEQKVRQVRTRAALHGLWDLGDASNGRITIISGCIPPEEGAGTTIEMGDNDGIVHALLNLSMIGRASDVKVVTCSDVSEQMLAENIVCIGGPYYNSATRRFMQEIRSPFVFDFSDISNDDTPIIDCINDKCYQSIWKDHHLIKDYGFFARFINPFNSAAHVILACGIETAGVSGAIRAFTADYNQHFVKVYDAIVAKNQISSVKEQLVDFFCLMSFGVELGGTVTLPSLKTQVAHIICDWKEVQYERTQVDTTGN